MRGLAEGDENAPMDDATLLSRLHALVERDHTTTARLLWHLGEVDVRGVHRDEGYSALFEYCIKALHMSESEASLRIRAARLSRQFPAVLGLVERGEVHLSALRMLAPVLTQNNHLRLLRAATHKTKRQVEVLVADLSPQPDAPSSIRKLPAARSSAAGPPPNATLDLLSVPVPAPTTRPDRSEQHAKAPSAPAVQAPVVSGRQQTQVATPPAKPATIQPLGQERYRVQFTADKTLHDQLVQAQELLRHQVPNGDLATIVGQAVALLVEQTKKRRFGQTRKARAATQRGKKATRAKKQGKGPQAQLEPKTGSRHIPHAVRREVLKRDGMRCTFVSGKGHRCEATGMLEFHHDEPFARGGPPTVANVRLLCCAHNALMAERDFGRDYIQQARRGRPSRHVRHQTVPEPSHT